MRTIIIFKSILDITFIMSLFGIVGYPLLFFLEDSVKVNGNSVNPSEIGGKLVLFGAYLSYIIFVYVVFLFKKTAYWLLRMKIFSQEVAQNIYKIGVLSIVIAFLDKLPVFFYNLYSRENIGIAIQTNTMFFGVAIGLFFMIMSKVIKIAQNMKEENELTI